MSPGRAPEGAPSEDVEIRELTEPSAVWAELRAALWPETSAKEHGAEQLDVLNDPEAAVFLARRGEVGVGFAEVTARAAPPGLAPGRVGFLEGIYVAPELRRTGLGERLVLRARRWAESRGCQRFGSDTEVLNRGSRAFHAALGFREIEAGELVLFEWESPAT